MNRKILSLIPLILATGILAGVFVLLTAFAPAPVPAQAVDINPRCDFLTITVTAAGLGVTPGISDTLPGGSADRVVYFANHQTGTMTLTVVLTDLHSSDPCYLWAAPAWGITSIREYTATQGSPGVVITYSVAPQQSSATVVLTSSQYITGSLYATLFQEKILTFTRDITGPVVSNLSITTTARHLWPVSTTLYYTQASSSGESFQIKGSSSEPSGEAGLWKTTFVAADLGCGGIQPGVSYRQDWLATYSLCNLPGPGVLTATSYDYVGNFTPVTFAYQIDGQPPSSTVTTTVQVSYGKVPIPLRWSAEDSGSGVKEVQIYARSGGQWGSPVFTTTSPDVSFVPPIVYLTGPITYEFASAAVDHLGNTEPLSSVADARVAVHPARLYLPLVLRNWKPLTNGSFEDGLAGWTVTQSPLPVSIVNNVQERTGGTTGPADGSRILLLGNPDYPCNGVPLGYAAVEQTFVVPHDAVSLTFKYIIWTQDASPVNKYDYDLFEVYLNEERKFDDTNRHTTGLGCNNWWRVPGPDNPRNGVTTGWAPATLDLRPYRGQMVTLSFRLYSRADNWYNTYVYIDDVQIVR
jgi:hypothetical protein